MADGNGDSKVGLVGQDNPLIAVSPDDKEAIRFDLKRGVQARSRLTIRNI